MSRGKGEQGRGIAVELFCSVLLSVEETKKVLSKKVSPEFKDEVEIGIKVVVKM